MMWCAHCTAVYVPEQHEAHSVGAVHVAIQVLDKTQDTELHQQLLLFWGATQVRDDVGDAVPHLVVGQLQQLLHGAEDVAVQQHLAVGVIDG